MLNIEPQRPYLVALGGADLRYSSYDVLVIGGGIGGLTAALGAARTWNVALLTKSRLDDTTTFLAQGGIAAAMAPYDSPELHLHDTLVAGEGLCDEDAVRILVEEGPGRVKELEGIGTKFDRTNGHLVLVLGGSAFGAQSGPRRRGCHRQRGGERTDGRHDLGEHRGGARERVRHRPAHG